MYANRGLVQPVRSLVPLEAVMWSQPITWAHPFYLLVQNRAGLGQTAAAPWPAQPLWYLRLWVRLPGWKAKQPWPVWVISSCVWVCVYFLIYLSQSLPCRELQRCEMCSVCVYRGRCFRQSWNSTSFLSDLSIFHREGFFSFLFLFKHLKWGKTSPLAKQKKQVICLFVFRYFGEAEVYIINIYCVAMEQGMYTPWS